MTRVYRKATLQAKDGLENYCFTIRNTLQGERLMARRRGQGQDREGGA
eukprot:CAMPEP_0179108034 /NCGR_PEP_ID=MMETSP0796-20121207/50304_1 /TAXON_ID=73915 /ORGANISM="Pyrodinium bahamense, Strain pbaha01" /LENGTH=47 /DNA_ID= /DNA_START= /DNA_END= /DNA_ORIENTATION=